MFKVGFFTGLIIIGEAKYVMDCWRGKSGEGCG
jgi:hypothetical protein